MPIPFGAGVEVFSQAVSLSLTVNRFESEGIRHDADVLCALIQEQDHINVLIEPGHEA